MLLAKTRTIVIATAALRRDGLILGVLILSSRFPSACAREALPRELLAKSDATCKENHSKVSLTIACFTPLSEIREAKFAKNGRILRCLRDGAPVERLAVHTAAVTPLQRFNGLTT